MTLGDAPPHPSTAPEIVKHVYCTGITFVSEQQLWVAELISQQRHHIPYEGIIDPFMVSFQLVEDACASSPCHHGNCSSSGSDGYVCICNEGYEGPDCEQALSSVPASGWTESTAPRQLQPVPATQEPEVMLPRSQATIALPTWQPKTGQKVVEMKWDQVEVRTLSAHVFMWETSTVKIIPVVLISAIKIKSL